MYCACWYDLDPIQGQGEGRGFWICKNCTFQSLSPPPVCLGAWSWWLIMIILDLVCSLPEPDFLISFSVSYHVIQTLWNVSVRGLSKGHISLLLEARVTWSGMLVVLYVLCMLIWHWPDPMSRSHGDNRQPPFGAFIVDDCCLLHGYSMRWYDDSSEYFHQILPQMRWCAQQPQ